MELVSFIVKDMQILERRVTGTVEFVFADDSLGDPTGFQRVRVGSIIKRDSRATLAEVETALLEKASRLLSAAAPHASSLDPSAISKAARLSSQARDDRMTAENDARLDEAVKGQLGSPS